MFNWPRQGERVGSKDCMKKLKSYNMKHLCITTILLTLLMSMLGIEATAHDIAVANSDGKTIY